MIDIVEALKSGKVVAIPTDTVYGLICDANNKNAIDKIYNIKGRVINKPISIFVKDKNSIKPYIENSHINIDNLLDKYWPGSLTVIFRKKEGTLPYLNIGNEKIGIRVPNNKLLLDILSSISFPLAQTSCNLSGEPPYVDSNTINNKLGDKIDVIVENDNIEVKNIASTIIDISNGFIKVIRSGDICEKEKFES